MQADDMGRADALAKRLEDVARTATIVDERPTDGPTSRVITEDDRGYLTAAAASIRTFQEERVKFAQEVARERAEIEGERAKLRAERAAAAREARTPTREVLPVSRESVTRKFKIPQPNDASLKFYLIAGTYPDGRLGEIFIRADKVGTLASGAFDAVAMCISVALQYGVPLEAFTGKMRGMRFEPAGFTGDKEFPSCTSVLDLVARWLEKRFVPVEPEEVAPP